MSADLMPFDTRPEPPEPPVNYEAEQALLGAVLANNRAYERVADFLKPEHFAETVHGQIYAVAAGMIDQGQQANAVTMKAYFDQVDVLKDVGGAGYLVELQSNYVSIVGVPDYARTIQDLYERRELIQLGEDLVADAHAVDLDRPAGKIREEHEAEVFKLAEDGEREGGLVSLRDTTQATMSRLKTAWAAGDELVGLSTGFKALDALTSGLEAPDLVILAGRPGMGKTALALSMADRIAHNDVTGFFSLEMGETQLATRHISQRAGVSFKRLQSGKCGYDEQQKAEKAAAAIAKLGLFIDGSANLSVHQMHARARRLKRKHGLSLLIVDHLGYVKAPDPRASEVKQPGDKLKAIKEMAKSLGVPVLVLQQLSRANLQREDRRPTLGDLRGSGMIEEDADAVWFVHRDAYYVERAEPKRRSGEHEDKFRERQRFWEMELQDCRNDAEVIVAKQRNGAIDSVNLRYDARFMAFDDAQEEQQEVML